MSQFEKGQLVDWLIENDEGVDTHFTEDDREGLMAMNEDTLENIVKQQIAIVENAEGDDGDDEPVSVVNAYGKKGCGSKNMKGKKKKKVKPNMQQGDEEGTVTGNEGRPSLEEWLEGAPPEVSQLVTENLEFNETQRSGLVKRIVENSANKFSEDQLGRMQLTDLQSLADTLQASPTQNTANRIRNRFSGAGSEGAATTNGKKGDGLSLPTMNWDGDKND